MMRMRVGKIGKGTSKVGKGTSKVGKGTSKIGKGTTSVVPFDSTKDAALAAEGQLKHLVDGSRFSI